MVIQKENDLIQEAFEVEADEIGFCLDQKWGDCENPYENSDTALAFNLFKKGWQAAKASVVSDEPKCEGGYYLQDSRGYIGNSMKFWYTHGYGTKLHNFHWFPTLEDALKAAGGAPWHKTWYAPYIDSLAEKTIDMQLASREQEKTMIEAQEQSDV